MNPLFPELDKTAIAEGARRRDRALEQVSLAAPTDWMGWALLAVRYVATRRQRFTTDPVWSVLESWAVQPPPEPRALGPVMRHASVASWCEPTGEYVMSSRPPNHRRPVAVYRSNLYRRST